MVSIGFVLPACGHWIYAVKKAGLKLLWFYEKGNLGYETYRLNFPLIQGYFGSLLDHQFQTPDLIVGSPPCKGFSHGINYRQVDIPLNNLIEYFGLLVGKIKPKVFLMENVPHVVKRWDHLEKCKNNVIDYNLTEAFLDSKDYGGFQRRKRYFLAGVRRDLEKEFIFPNSNRAKEKTVEQAIGDLELVSEDANIDHVWNLKEQKIMGTFRTIPRTRASWTVTGWSCRWRHYLGGRNVSLLELKRIMGLPDNWKLLPGSIQRKCQAIAEGVDVNLLQRIFFSIHQQLTV